MMWGLATTITINLCIGVLVFQLAYDSSKDYSPVEGPVQCLKMDNPARTLCAQCVTRPNNIQYDKALFLDNKHPVGVLEMPLSATPLSCAELLQLVTVADGIGLEAGAAARLV